MVLRQRNMVPMQLPQGLTIQQGMQRARVPRRPSHPFHIVQQAPYELTPFFIAPVLAGETMKNLLLQARTVSTPVKNALIGHHLEHYFFYVKLRDLSDANDIVKMLMDVDADTNVQKASANNGRLYVKAQAPDFMRMCLDAVVKAYFRDEGDNGTWTGANGLPLVHWANKNTFLESMVADDELETGNIPDAVQPFPAHEEAYNSWLFMRQNQLTEMTFEDYLGTFGVRLTETEANKPELIRFIKNWTYPSNTVDGSGNVNSQLSWSIQERADKDRFFKEPGFLIGLSVARPKVYISSQVQSSISLLDRALHWLPATMKEEVSSSLKHILSTGGGNSPFAHSAPPQTTDWPNDKGIWLDVRDLFVHGEQFISQSAAIISGAANGDINRIPPKNLSSFHGKKYPDDAALKMLGAGGDLLYNSDGIVSLNVLGTQVDMT